MCIPPLLYVVLHLGCTCVPSFPLSICTCRFRLFSIVLNICVFRLFSSSSEMCIPPLLSPSVLYLGVDLQDGCPGASIGVFGRVGILSAKPLQSSVRSEGLFFASIGCRGLVVSSLKPCQVSVEIGWKWQGWLESLEEDWGSRSGGKLCLKNLTVRVQSFFYPFLPTLCRVAGCSGRDLVEWYCRKVQRREGMVETTCLVLVRKPTPQCGLIFFFF